MKIITTLIICLLITGCTPLKSAMIGASEGAKSGSSTSIYVPHDERQPVYSNSGKKIGYTRK